MVLQFSLAAVGEWGRHGGWTELRTDVGVLLLPLTPSTVTSAEAQFSHP